MALNNKIILASSLWLASCSNPSGTLNDGYQTVSSTTQDAASTVGAGAKEAANHAENFAVSAKDGAYSVADRVASWMEPEKKKPPQPIPASYCYRTYQDILCYRRPMPGWEFRLVSYQPLTAEPPPPAIMQPLLVHDTDASKLPANRVAASKPVFTQIPKAVDAETSPEEPATSAAAAADATHEQLPDPALAPQL